MKRLIYDDGTPLGHIFMADQQQAYNRIFGGLSGQMDILTSPEGLNSIPSGAAASETRGRYTK